jgi:hypothetical protein
MEEPYKHLHEQVFKSLQKLETIIDNDEKDFNAMYAALRKFNSCCKGNSLALQDGLKYLSGNPKIKEIPPWLQENVGVSITLVEGRALLQYINICKFDWRFDPENDKIMIPPAFNSIEHKEWLSRLKRFQKEKQRREADPVPLLPLASQLKGGSMPGSRRPSLEAVDGMVEIRQMRSFSMNSTPLPSARGDHAIGRGGDLSFSNCPTMDEEMVTSDGFMMHEAIVMGESSLQRQGSRRSFSRHSTGGRRALSRENSMSPLRSSVHPSLVQDLMDQAQGSPMKTCASQESSPCMPRLSLPRQQGRMQRGASESNLRLPPAKSVGGTPSGSPSLLIRKAPVGNALGALASDLLLAKQLPRPAKQGDEDKQREGEGMLMDVVATAVAKARQSESFRKEGQLIKNEVFRVLNI